MTCGGCNRQWCERCDGTQGPLCHYCHGRGYSTAPRGVPIRFKDSAHGGEVTLTIKPGQTLSHSEGGRTDEGYSYTGTTWKFERGELRCETYTEARDCDGRLDTGGVYFANAIKANGFPDWTHEDSYQRDHSAEAMGY